MIWLVVISGVAVGCYFLFRDTLNRLQYIQTFRIYWITRDVCPPGTPRLALGRMYQTQSPWWQGVGPQLRIGKYIVQVGILRNKGASLLDQLGGRYLDESPKQLREWDGTAKIKEKHKQR